MIKRNYLFFPDKQKDRIDGLLRLRVRWNDQTVSFNVGYRVDFSKWIADAQRVKANTTHGKYHTPAFEINKQIEKFIEYCDAIFNQYEVKGTAPTAEEFKTDFYVMLGKKRHTGVELNDTLENFIQTQSIQNSWTQATCGKFRTIFSKMKSYRNVAINDIDDSFLQEYIEHQQEVGYRNTTILKELKMIYWFLRWCKRNDHYDGNSFDTFRPRLKTTQKEVIYLTWDELQKLYHFQFDTNTALNKVRDLFCFCCFSGLRYSDMAKLQKTDIYDGVIHVVTKKTNDTLQIELNDYTSEILSRYKHLDSNLALPVISNVKMNDHLKVMARIAGLDEPIKQVYYIGNERKETIQPKYELITTHCGRRTFVVNAMYLGIAPEVIMKWTGHSDYESMKPYMAVVDKLKKQEMSKFNFK